MCRTAARLSADGSTIMPAPIGDWRIAAFSGAGFLRPADDLPAIGCPLVCPIGQTSDEGSMPAQTGRSQGMADIGGKTPPLGFDQIGDRLHQMIEPRSPFGVLEQIDIDLQRVF